MALDGWHFKCSTPNFYSNVDSGNNIDLKDGEFYEDGRHSQTGQAIEGNSQTARIFYVGGQSLAKFADDCLGYTLPPGLAGPKYLQRTLPDRHPKFFNWYAMEMSWEPIGPGNITGVAPAFGQSEDSDWQLYKVTVIYRPAKYNIFHDFPIFDEWLRWTEKTDNITAELISWNNGARFVNSKDPAADPGNVLSVSPAIITPSVTRTYLWRQIPSRDPEDGFDPYINPMKDKILAAIGRTNKNPFDGHATSTMVLLRAPAEMVNAKFSSANSTQLYWNQTYEFMIKDNGPGLKPEIDDLLEVPNKDNRAGVNYFINPTDGEYHLVTGGTNAGKITGVREYSQEYDFRELFRYGTPP